MNFRHFLILCVGLLFTLSCGTGRSPRQIWTLEDELREKELMEQRSTSRPEEEKIIDMELERLRTEESDNLLDILINNDPEPENPKEPDLW